LKLLQLEPPFPKNQVSPAEKKKGNMAETIDGAFYLVLRQNPIYWWKMTARVTSSQPKLQSNERVMRLDVKVPRAIFQTPALKATISVPEDAVSKPLIDAVVLDNVREIIQQQTGLNVSVSLVEPTRLHEEAKAESA
jgi:hypothetical protein